MSWKNLPFELVMKILVEFDGRFVLRNGRLLFIDKLLKDDARYSMLSPIIPHPNLQFCEVEEHLFPRVFLQFSTEKQYVISLWYDDEGHNADWPVMPSIDVMLLIKFENDNGWDQFSIFIGTF